MFGQLARKASVVLGIQRRRERNFVSFLNRLRLNPLRADPGYLFLSLCSRMWVQSQAQLFQDVMALSFSGCKRNGYFVEIGACDGKFLSNTYLLEKEFGWTGIVVEPARVWEHDLHQNRSCLIDTRCVWPKSNQSIQFSETRIPEYSTTAARLDSDIAARFREKSKQYEISSVSLFDLLHEHGAPQAIDYLSIDTEGSEFNILNAFDFTKYSFGIISVEHNYDSKRNAIYSLLASHGYRRVLPHLSQWDDWYISRQHHDRPQ